MEENQSYKKKKSTETRRSQRLLEGKNNNITVETTKKRIVEDKDTTSTSKRQKNKKVLEPPAEPEKKSKAQMSQPAPKKSHSKKEKRREKKKAEKEKENQPEEAEKVEKESVAEVEAEEDTLDFDDSLFGNYEEVKAQPENLSSPKPPTNEAAMRGLLSKLSSPNDAFAPNPLSRSKLNILLTGLKDEGNEAAQLQSLMELCDFLSIGTEENMSGFHIDSFVPLLVNLLHMEHSPDIMLLSCRCLAYLMEALPQASGSLVSHQAVPALCQKLLSIEYIDLAEQALQCLEKISYDNPVPLLREGALMAVLMFLDFFPSGTQRLALNTAANLCRNIAVESFDKVADVIPILTNLTQYQDAKLVEKAIVCLSRLADSLYGSDKLEELAKYGLIPNLVRLVASNTGFLSPASTTLIMRLLTSLCVGSPSIVQSLLQDGEGIINVLQGVLVSGSANDAPSGSISPEQLYEILSLINEFLPPLPKEVTTFLSAARPIAANTFGLKTGRAPRKAVPQEQQDKTEESGSEEESIKEQEPPKPAEKPVAEVAKPQKQDSRAILLQEKPGLLVNLGERLLYPLLQVFNTSVNFSVRHKCLLVVTKMIYFSTSDSLRELLRNITVSSFIANMLTSTDISIVATALKIAEFLMEKLPDIFDKYFKREGVVYEVERLSQSTEKLRSSNQNNNNANVYDPYGGVNVNAKEIENWVREHAMKFKESYFGKGNLDENNISELLKTLKASVAKLQGHLRSARPDSTDKDILEELAKCLCGEENVSTFEFLKSNLVEALLAYLTTVESPSDRSGILQERASLFCNVFLRTTPNSMEIDKDKSSPFAILIQKLHLSLNKLERFPVILNEMSGAANGIKYLTQPFKLKLQRASDLADPSVKDYAENVVLIEPLATVNAIIDFLIPRIKADVKETPKENSKEEVLQPMEVEEPNQLEVESENKAQFLDEYEEDDDEEEEEAYNRPPEPVHDVQLDKLSASQEIRSSQSIPQLKLSLSVNGIPLPNNSTVFQALQTVMRKQDGTSEESAPQPIYRLWENVHTINYTVIPLTTETTTTTPTSKTYYLYEVPYLQILSEGFPQISENTDQTFKILMLARILNELNWMWGYMSKESKFLVKRYITSPTDFINNKLTAKLLRQLQDLLTLCSGSLPEWSKKLPLICPFLFPYDIRKLYLQCTSFGIARALHALQQFLQGINAGRNNEIRIGRIQRQKVRLARDRLLDSARKAMEMYGKSKAILEVEYFGEVGTGLGPTLEFYTLVSQELQRKDLRLWRDDKPLKPSMEIEGKQEEQTLTQKFVHTSGGLFPAPVKLGDDPESLKILDLFKFVGTFIAKALLDSRLLDLPLSIPFLKWMLNKGLTYLDLKVIDPELGSSLEKLVNLNKQALAIQNDPSLTPSEKESRIKSLQLGGAFIEDLDLDFTVPGSPACELKPNGASIAVTIQNLDEYLNLVVDYHLNSGVSKQLEALRKGFNEVFPMGNLSVFTVEELDSMLAGKEEMPWDIQTLIENTRCDHGYSHNSQTVKDLFEIMTEFTADERRQFLLFVTGSPRLPVGGFRSLDPKLTIVRKEHGKEGPDSHLPSVNCCFYYLKIPEYSSKKALKEKLMFAIEHGQGSFSFN